MTDLDTRCISPGRVVCVADVFDAFTTKRPCKEAWSPDRAFNLLASERGKPFDPFLVDALLANSGRVQEIYCNNKEVDVLELPR